MTKDTSHLNNLKNLDLSQVIAFWMAKNSHCKNVIIYPKHPLVEGYVQFSNLQDVPTHRSANIITAVKQQTTLPNLHYSVLPLKAFCM